MISREDALRFLKANQPLPNDDLLEKDIETFREAVDFFIVNSDEKCIPLFLNCFGGGSGFGLYQNIGDLMLMYEDAIVIASLKVSLFSEIASVRYWCSQICDNYESLELVDGLINAYNKGDDDSKCAALTALSSIECDKVKLLARSAITHETDSDLLEIAYDIVNS